MNRIDSTLSAAIPISVAMSLPERTRPRPSAHRKSNAELLASSNLGKSGRFFDGADVIELLREAVVREGGISAFAKRAGLHRADINNTLKGRLPVSRTLVKVLGLRKVYTAE